MLTQEMKSFCISGFRFGLLKKAKATLKNTCIVSRTCSSYLWVNYPIGIVTLMQQSRKFAFRLVCFVQLEIQNGRRVEFGARLQITSDELFYNQENSKFYVLLLHTTRGRENSWIYPLQGFYWHMLLRSKFTSCHGDFQLIKSTFNLPKALSLSFSLSENLRFLYEKIRSLNGLPLCRKFPRLCSKTFSRNLLSSFCRLFVTVVVTLAHKSQRFSQSICLIMAQRSLQRNDKNRFLA